MQTISDNILIKLLFLTVCKIFILIFIFQSHLKIQGNFSSIFDNTGKSFRVMILGGRKKFKLFDLFQLIFFSVRSNVYNKSVPRPRVETFLGPVSSFDSFRPILFSFSIKNLKIIILICFENETTSETRDHREPERCIRWNQLIK